MNEWAIYWITRLDRINLFFEAFAFMFFLFTLGFIISSIFAWVEEDENQFKKSILSTFILGLIFVFCLVSHIFIPTTRDMLLIKGVPAIVNSKEAGKLRVALNKLLDEYLKQGETKNESSRR